MLQLGQVTKPRVESREELVYPFRTYCYETKYSEDCGYICPDGYDQETEKIRNGGSFNPKCMSKFTPRKDSYYRNSDANTCARCVRNDAPPVLTAPYGPGGCPKNYIPDHREVCATPPSSEGGFRQSDGIELARCSSLGADYVTLTSTPQGCGAKMSWNGANVVVYGTKYECMACVVAPIVRQWEEFAGPFNRVCRGAGPTDNNPDYFDVRQNVPSIEACQALCLQELGEEGCKGIEFNRNSKRCELWKRKEGIWAFDYPQWEGFTCLRYGWPGKYLIPVNGGLDQACRGPDGKNSDSFYVVEAVRHMEDCRARCVAAPICKGVEFSEGRCEIWTSEVATTEAKVGFECLRYEPTVDSFDKAPEPPVAQPEPPVAQPEPPMA
eukprot:Skav205381  [mRNA]  locus=scaffold277:133735:135689:+ [translate_table: standard]